MLQYLKRKIYKWVKEQHNHDNLVELQPVRAEPDHSFNRLLNSKPLSFNLYRANGGWIVETRNFNDQKAAALSLAISGEESKPRLHIVHDDQDLGQALGKIVVLENLKS